jgi:hypothetical protein
MLSERRVIKLRWRRPITRWRPHCNSLRKYDDDELFYDIPAIVIKDQFVMLFKEMVPAYSSI